jgi:hypothetical protein
MAVALDYSAGFPGGSAVKVAASGVVRYVGTPGRTKNITASEYRDMTANGVGVALVYENRTGDSAGGYAAGVTAAQAARADANNVGFPTNRPIYFAIDSDQGATPPAVVAAYLDGAASVLGKANTGVYGQYSVIEQCVPSHAAYGWQTAAWSGGKRSAKAALYQRIGTVVVGGIGCDINDILVTDWGQHSYAGASGTTTSSQEDEMAFGAQAAAGTGQHVDIATVGCKNLRIHCSFNHVVKVRAVLFYKDTGGNPQGDGAGGGYDGEFRKPAEHWDWAPNRPGPMAIPAGATTCTVLYDADSPFYVSAAVA